jgi:hypothetical protein
MTGMLMVDQGNGVLQDMEDKPQQARTRLIRPTLRIKGHGYAQLYLPQYLRAGGNAADGAMNDKWFNVVLSCLHSGLTLALPRSRVYILLELPRSPFS